MVLTVILALLSLYACDPFGSPISLPKAPVVEQKAPVEEQVEAIPLEEPRVILDYSKYKAVDDPDYYKGKYMGEIFLVKDYKTTGTIANTLTVYGKIPFVIHPDNELSLIDSMDPNQPIIVTGYGEGWGKVVTRGEGHSGGFDISVECTSEIKAEFRLVGGFYPAPSCILDVNIVPVYFSDGEGLVHCVYDNGMVLDSPIESYEDLFTDVKLPIDFHIPDQYVTRYAKTENNVIYDLSYYLYNFYGKPPAKDPVELQLVFGDTPSQIMDTGCGDVHLDLGVVTFPEGSEWTEKQPSAWDVMLTPESQRTAD
mgnify:CR=1 FL=1